MNHLNYLGQIMGMKRPHLRHFAAQAGETLDWTCLLYTSMAATLGSEIDKFLRRLELTDIASATAADALASVLLEQVCDCLLYTSRCV